MHLRRFVLAIGFVACGGSEGEPATAPPQDVPVDDDAGGGVEKPGDAGAATDANSNPNPSPPDAGDAGGADDGPDVPYDRAFQKSIHNAYERSEPLLDQLVYHRVRSVELDIHVAANGASAPASEWFVYHDDPKKTSCTRLSDCLRQLSAFHAAVPKHEVVTVFVDLKESFSQGHAPEDLDLALTGALGRSNVLAPADLVEACQGATSVRDAVTGACAFPTLGALRGKFVFAVTGGTSCQDSLVARYGGEHPRERIAFVAPNVDASCPVASYDARPDIVFLNMPSTEMARASEVQSRGLVARIYGLNDASSFDAGRTAGAEHLATDKVNFATDPWTILHGPRGFPFACEGCGADLVEPGSVVGVRASGGDLWQTADSAFQALVSDAAESTWSALVSVPSSHVEPFAKACLVARASEDPGAANVAVCRPFDANPPRAQIRSTNGGTTSSVDGPTFAGVSAESPAFLRLAVRENGAGSRVTAAVSADGTLWSTITTVDLAMPLPLRGVSVSAHGGPEVKGLFVNLTRTEGATSSVVGAGDLAAKAVGAGASGAVFDGVFPP